MPTKETLRQSLVKKQEQQKKEWLDYRAGKADKPSFAKHPLAMPEEHYDKLFKVKPVKKGR